MKAIINGKRYNTETANFIGTHETDCSITDFSWWEAGLYRTPRSGLYFLAGKGGPMTRWSRAVDGGGWTGGRKIIPLNETEALEWAERYLTVNEVEQAFADILEDA